MAKDLSLPYILKHNNIFFLIFLTVFGAIGAVIAFLFLLVIIFIIYFSRPMVSDRWLEQNFYSHQNEFSQIIQLIKEDTPVPVNGINYGYDIQRSKVTKQYEELLQTCGLDNDGAIFFYGSESVDLIVQARGFLNAGSYKGYTYAERNVYPVVDSLDTVRKDPRGGKVYKHLTGNWYLYYMWGD